MPTPRKPDPFKVCAYCGQRLVRKRSRGLLMSLALFRKYKFCDRACYAKAKIHSNPSQSALCARSRRFRKDACEACGTTTRLQVHHVDGNRFNLDAANLKTLCISCHLSWHWANGWKRIPGRGREANGVDVILVEVD
jgi:hypothetical protein